MADQSQSTPPGPEELAKAFAEIAEHSQKIAAEFLARTAAGKPVLPEDDIGVDQRLHGPGRQDVVQPDEAGRGADAHVARLHAPVAQLHVSGFLGEKPEPVAQAAKSDNRFKSEVWENNFLFDYIKQSYLIAAENIQKTVAEVAGARPADRAQGEVLHAPVRRCAGADQLRVHQPGGAEGHGRLRRPNLIDGLHHLLDDLERGGGQLAISMTDYSAFKVGENVATTPGKVVYQNDLMQLIQFSPSTETVWRDAAADHSALDQQVLHPRPAREELLHPLGRRAGPHRVRDLLGQSRTSATPTRASRTTCWRARCAALNAIEQATGEREVNVIGYCLGGTLLACLLAWLAAKGEQRVKSATFFTAHDRLHRAGRAGRVRRRGRARQPREEDGGARLSRRLGDGHAPSTCCAPTT